MSPSIPENLEKVRHQISRFEKKYARAEKSVQLIAVSKTHSADKIREAYDAGQRDFGENYLQEALEKISQLSDLDITWHYIGPIQSNKTRAIAENFHWVHSVDRQKIAERLNDQRPDSLPPLNVLLQVNISAETSKSGVTLNDLSSLVVACKDLNNIILSGLMAIPAPSEDFEQQKAAFHLLCDAKEKLVALGFDQCLQLSMGMSRDFEAAIAEGATMIRIGTDIFGPRT